jgi:hypothetical protein
MEGEAGSPGGRRSEHFRDFSETTLPKPFLKDRFCPRPFEHVEIMHGYGPDQSEGFGDVYLCCAGWLSKKVGNYLQQNMANIWNSPAAREIRASILDGSYRYCNAQACPFIQDGRLEHRDTLSGHYRTIVDEGRTYLEGMPLSYLLCYDRSCNLTCPSCRMNKILFTHGPGVSLPRRLNQKLMADLFFEPHDRPVHLQVTGSGDPFASQPFRELLGAIEGRSFPNLRVELFTNGVMLTEKTWLRLANISANVRLISVSIDAASAQTYAAVRGGDWEQLMANLAFIGGLLRQGSIDEFHTNYVVQLANVHEIGDFVRLSRLHAVTSINFSLVADWHTWSRADFLEQAVWRPTHARFPELLEALRDPDLDDPIVRLGPLAAYRALALKGDPPSRQAGMPEESAPSLHQQAVR